MAFKLKLVTGEEFPIDEKTRKALLGATVSSFTPVTVTSDSGEPRQMMIAQGAVAYIEGVADEQKSAPDWFTVKRR